MDTAYVNGRQRYNARFFTVNPNLERLQSYPFQKLSALLDGAKPNPDYSQIALHIGEPKHPTPEFIKKALIHASLKDKDLEIYKDANNTAMFRGGATFADAITFGAAKIEKKLVDEFSKVRGKKTLLYNPDGDLTDYLQLYGDLAGK